MDFLRLPQEIQFWVFYQNDPSFENLYPFLLSLGTSLAAQHRLIYNREVAIKCQEKVEISPTQYGFGLYGKVYKDEKLQVSLDLHQISQGDQTTQKILKYSRFITINACFEGLNGEFLAQNLSSLSSQLENTCGKVVELQIMAKYLDLNLTDSVLAAISGIAKLNNLTVDLQLHVTSTHLQAYAEGLGHMKLHLINIESIGKETLEDEVKFGFNADLRKFKLTTNFKIPKMSFVSSSSSELTHLELNLPIDLHAEWVQNGHILQFQKLQDLRLFTFSDISCLFPISHAKSFPILKSLYLQFLDVVHNYEDLNFRAFAPQLEFLYLADKKATTTKRPI